jgi:hypothetical protein
MDNLMERLKCIVLSAHDWKRAVRVGTSEFGTQACRHCAKVRSVSLRRARGATAPENSPQPGPPLALQPASRSPSE